MKKVERILVVIDPTATEQPALRRAIELSKSFGSALHLVICDRDPVYKGRLVAALPGLENARAALEQDYRERLDGMADDVTAALGGDAPPVTTTVRWDYPLADGIVRQVEESATDLVMKDTRYHGPIRRALFTHTDWELIRHCPVPLWLVRADVELQPATIVAAVAPLDVPEKEESLDVRILTAAGTLSRSLGGRLHVFHAFPVPVFGGAGIPPGETAALTRTTDEMFADRQKEHRQAVAKLLQRCEIDDVDVGMRAGTPKTLLVDYADEVDATVVVMGAVSRSMVERVVLGSTAESTLDRLASDVLIVK